MAKYNFSVSFRDDDETYVSMEGAVNGDSEDDALENLQEYIAGGVSFERVEQEYNVSITVSFTFTDEDGEYDEASDLQQAIEGGDFDWSTEDYMVDEVSVDEA